jgi:hypothetical protein
MDSSQFSVIKILRKGRQFKGTHYIEYILELILELRPEYVRPRLIIDAYNATPYIVRQSQ